MHPWETFWIGMEPPADPVQRSEFASQRETLLTDAMDYASIDDIRALVDYLDPNRTGRVPLHQLSALLRAHRERLARPGYGPEFPVADRLTSAAPNSGRRPGAVEAPPCVQLEFRFRSLVLHTGALKGLLASYLEGCALPLGGSASPSSMAPGLFVRFLLFPAVPGLSRCGWVQSCTSRVPVELFLGGTPSLASSTVYAPLDFIWRSPLLDAGELVSALQDDKALVELWLRRDCFPHALIGEASIPTRQHTTDVRLGRAEVQLKELLRASSPEEPGKMRLRTLRAVSIEPPVVFKSEDGLVLADLLSTMSTTLPCGPAVVSWVTPIDQQKPKPRVGFSMPPRGGPSATLSVVCAHLHMDRSVAPCTLVSYGFAHGGTTWEEVGSTPVAYHERSPKWNHVATIRLPELGWAGGHLSYPGAFKELQLVLRVWDVSEWSRSQHLIGMTYVELTPLSIGFPEVDGYYDIVNGDFTLEAVGGATVAGRCQGQVRVAFTPTWTEAGRPDKPRHDMGSKGRPAVPLSPLPPAGEPPPSSSVLAWGMNSLPSVLASEHELDRKFRDRIYRPGIFHDAGHGAGVLDDVSTTALRFASRLSDTELQLRSLRGTEQEKLEQLRARHRENLAALDEQQHRMLPPIIAPPRWPWEAGVGEAGGDGAELLERSSLPPSEAPREAQPRRPQGSAEAR